MRFKEIKALITEDDVSQAVEKLHGLRTANVGKASFLDCENQEDFNTNISTIVNFLHNKVTSISSVAYDVTIEIILNSKASETVNDILAIPIEYYLDLHDYAHILFSESCAAVECEFYYFDRGYYCNVPIVKIAAEVAQNKRDFMSIIEEYNFLQATDYCFYINDIALIYNRNNKNKEFSYHDLDENPEIGFKILEEALVKLFVERLKADKSFSYSLDTLEMYMTKTSRCSHRQEYKRRKFFTDIVGTL